MARIRTIKPEFWTDAALIECSLNARLLFIGTWNFADDEGNLDRSPKQIKARIFPADNVECEPLLHELIAHGLLTEYSVNGKKYLHIHSFKKHQVINRPGKPACPAFEDSLIIHGTITEPSLPEGKGREGKGLNTLPGKPGAVQLSDSLPAGFLRFWEIWPSGERKQSKGKCLETWKRKGCEKITEQIVGHIETLKASDGWHGGFVPAPLVYLNQARWEGAETQPQHERRVAL